MKFSIDDTILKIELSGEYTSFASNKDVENILNNLKSKKIKKIQFINNNLGKWNSTLMVYLFNIIKTANEKHIEINMSALPDELQRMIVLAFSVDRKPNQDFNKKQGLLESVGSYVISCWQSIKDGSAFVWNVIKSVFRFFRGKAIFRSVDLLFAIEDCSYRALPIVSLISFMVGLILAFVGAVQLRLFGAEIYIASLVSIGMVRIMGALMTGIIIAGRTGASYAATIGTMKVNEEVDALKTMGISTMDFLTLPRLISLVIMMPILTIFSDLMGILGGSTVGVFVIDIAPQEYYRMSLEYLTLDNFIVGIFHGFVFGWVVSLCGCYFGLNCERSADGVGKATTSAVVFSIVWIVITTGIITFILQMVDL